MIDLNPEQKPIVALGIDRCTRIIAGAGTGKTTTLVHRYLKFVFEDGVAPDHLLALTFTKKAAAEMVERVFSIVEERGDTALLRALYSAWIMNFHQFAFRVIVENGPAFGVDPDVTVASDAERFRFYRELYRRLESGTLDGYPYTHEAGMPVPTSLAVDFARDRNIMERARSRLMRPENLVHWCSDDDAPAYRRRIEGIVALWRNYEATLAARGVVDFDGMIQLAIDGLARNPTLCESYARRFHHILVDEFQDTSEAQNELLKLIAGKDFRRVTVVGDEKQSIYRWRDARVENLREFPGDEAYLKLNYRSTQGILDLAHRFITTDPAFHAQGEEIHLESASGIAGPPVCTFHPPEGSPKSFEQEAWAVASWIQSLTGALPPLQRPYASTRSIATPLGYGDIAILMRSLKASSGIQEYERVFGALGVPFTIHGGVSALENQVLELFKNVLLLVAYPNDTAALLALLEGAPLSLPDHWLEKLFAAARRVSEERTGRRRGGSASGSLLVLSGDVLSQIPEADVRRRCETLAVVLDDLRDKREALDLRAFVYDALETLQFYFHALAAGADRRLLDAITKVIVDLVEDLVKNDQASLSAFIESLQTLLEEGTLGDSDAASVAEGTVRIMTIHLAKGLEFPAVAVPGIKRMRSSRNGFVLVRGHGVYIGDEYTGRRRKDGEALARQVPGESCYGREEREQEERCLLYVAMTRAKRHLFLSSPFPGGMENEKTANNFATVLERLRNGGIDFEELRSIEPFDTPSPGAPAPGNSVAALGDLASTLDEWRDGRDRIAEARVAEESVRAGSRFVNWRALNMFRRCPLQYHYRHVAGVAEWPEDPAASVAAESVDATPDGVDPDRLLFGTFMHRLLFEWIGEGAAPESIVDDLAGRFGFAGKTKNRITREAMAAVAAFRETPLAGAADAHGLELPVQVRVPGMIFQGVIDRVDRDGDGLAIIDYKGEREREEYAWQVKFYAWALGKATGQPVRAGKICYLSQPAVVTDVDVSAAEVGAIENTARRLQEATRPSDFHASPGAACSECAYNSICPYAI